MHTPSSWTGLVNRRDMLRIGSLGVAASLLPSQIRASSSSATDASADSIILLWMAGGVTHIDSFDPKPAAPEEIRGTLQSIPTSLPGVRFTEVMPNLARQMPHIALVRSFSHDSNDHFVSQAHVLSGRPVNRAQITTEPNVGAIVNKLQGGRDGFPGYIAVPGTTRPGPPGKNLFVGGWLGQQYAPFASGGAPRNEDFTAGVKEAAEEDFHMQALQAPVDVDRRRLSRRRHLRTQLENSIRQFEQAGAHEAVDEQYRAAFTMLTSPEVREAFDLRCESARVRDFYGRTKIGQRCLLARRLVEGGARFIMVDYGYDPEYGNLWDNHRAPVQKQPHICDMAKLPYHLAGTDKAFAALIEDLHARGLLEKTMVVFLTEFGRTPRVNTRGGRDHWGAAGSIFFAGGGAKGGQVIGQTDKNAARPTSHPHSPGDVAATIYRAIGVDASGMLYDRQNRPHHILPEGKPIAEVFGA